MIAVAVVAQMRCAALDWRRALHPSAERATDRQLLQLARLCDELHLGECALWLRPSCNGEIGFRHLRPTDTPRPEAATPEIELQLVELTMMVPAAIAVFNGNRYEFAARTAGAFCEAKSLAARSIRDSRRPSLPQWKTAHVAVRAIACICCRGAVAVGRGREP